MRLVDDDVLFRISPTALAVTGPDGGTWVLCLPDELGMVRSAVSADYDQGEAEAHPGGAMVWFPVTRIEP